MGKTIFALAFITTLCSCSDSGPDERAMRDALEHWYIASLNRHMGPDANQDVGSVILNGCIIFLENDNHEQLERVVNRADLPDRVWDRSFYKVDIGTFDFDSAQIIEPAGLHQATYTASIRRRLPTDTMIAETRRIIEILHRETGKFDFLINTERHVIRSILRQKVRYRIPSEPFVSFVGGLVVLEKKEFMKVYQAMRTEMPDTISLRATFSAEEATLESLLTGSISIQTEVHIPAPSREVLKERLAMLKRYIGKTCPQN